MIVYRMALYFQVVNVNPGFHATPMHSNGVSSFTKAYYKQSPEMQAAYGEKFIRYCEKVSGVLLLLS